MSKNKLQKLNISGMNWGNPTGIFAVDYAPSLSNLTKVVFASKKSLPVYFHNTF